MKLIASLLLTALFAVNPRIKLQALHEQMARELLANFTAGRFEAATADFNDALRPLVTPALLAQVRGQLDSQVGAFQTVTAVHQSKDAGFAVVELIARFEKSPVSVRVVFDAFDRVGAVYINPIVAPPVDAALEAVARELLANLVAGRFDDAGKHFDDAMRAQLPPPGLAELSKQMTSRFGTVRSIIEVHQRMETPYRIIDLTATCDKTPLAFSVGFDAKNRIAALHIAPLVKP